MKSVTTLNPIQGRIVTTRFEAILFDLTHSSLIRNTYPIDCYHIFVQFYLSIEGLARDIEIFV